jgi:hypothetical protein|tara:strand:- start:102 stop:317 length:216 start_codon:yes stop_codon:yes gene_type:complete
VTGNTQEHRTSQFIKEEMDLVSRMLTGEQKVIEFEQYDAQSNNSGNRVKLNSKESRQQALLGGSKQMTEKQ